MQGKLLIISGLSGAGKGTLASRLIEKFDNFVLSISATTRDKRNGEVDGVHYFFKTHDEFENMIENNELLEYAKYVDNYYGTPRVWVEKCLKEGKNVILEIEMQGALKVKDIFDDAELIYLIPPSAKVQYERLKSRGRETEEQVGKRLYQAIVDATYADKYDYVLVNEDMDEVVNSVLSIVDGRYNREIKAKNLKILENIVNDIKEKKYV